VIAAVHYTGWLKNIPPDNMQLLRNQLPIFKVLEAA